MPKNVRFGDLVRSSGRPIVQTLWTQPARDRSFMQAVKANRVLTIVQEPTSKKKDYGEIGFHKQPHASYLLFPRTLPRNLPPRVIGINYNLIDEPEVRDPFQSRAAGTESKTRSKPASITKMFAVTLRRVAISDRSVEVEAANKAQARREALRTVRAEPFDPKTAEIHDEILAVKPSKSPDE